MSQHARRQARADRSASDRARPPEAGERRLSPSRYGLMFSLICLVYLATLSDAHVGWISDGQVMLDTAVSLREFGDLSIGYVLDPNQGPVPRADGYSRYGLGFSLFELIPLSVVGAVERTLGQGRSNVLFPLASMGATALTALVVALGMRSIGARPATGALAAVGFAFGTFAWPYISYDFSEPLQALCLALAFWLLAGVGSSESPTPARLALAGSALGLAVMTKAVFVVLVPGYALYLWLGLAGPPAQRLRKSAWFGFSLLAWGLLLAALNAYRFGSILEFGYGEESSEFRNPLLSGVYGLLVGPNKGLAFYAPLAILVPWSLWACRRTHRRECLFLASTLALHVMVTAKWWSWEGGASWGPRLLLPIVPLVAVAAALGLEAGRWWSRAYVALVAVGFAINLLGVLLNFMVWLSVAGASGKRVALDLPGRPAREYVERDGRRWFPIYIATSYLPALSPIRGHAWLLWHRYTGGFSSFTSMARPDSTRFGEVEVTVPSLKEGFLLSQLRSARLWMWDTVSGRPRDPTFSVPVYGASLLRLGDAAAATGNAPRASECYRRALWLMPDHEATTLKLSALQARQGSHDDAERTLSQYLARHPRQAAVHFHLAHLYEQAGRADAAIRSYRTYLEIGTDAAKRREAEQRLAELTGAPR